MKYKCRHLQQQTGKRVVLVKQSFGALAALHYGCCNVKGVIYLHSFGYFIVASF